MFSTTNLLNILHSKITLFWSYYEENLVPVKVKTDIQNYNEQ